jgi:ubiquinone biosynthesis accessory factor UbiJ
LKTVASGAQPEVKIFGDVLLAAEIGWIRDHVRWDIEADVARVIGDVPAVSLTRIVKGVIATVQQFSKRASA